MTRWARAKSALQQQKQPEDATPWKNFVKERNKQHFESTAKFEEKETSTLKIKKKNNLQDVSKKFKKPKKFKKLKLTSELKSQEVIDFEPSDKIDIKKNSNNQTLVEKNTKRQKRKGSKLNKPSLLQDNNTLQEFKSSTDQNEVPECEEIVKLNSLPNSGPKQNRKMLKKGKKVPENKLESPSVELNHGIKGNEKLSNEKQNSNNKFSKMKRKELLKAKLLKKRANQGLLLLPENVERNIYNFKKSLRKKGVPEEDLKRLVRRRRRKEELKYRKVTNKTCFKCRQPGHYLSECPLLKNDNEHGTNICFKCGSTEHISRECSSKSSDFPFAMCFICHQQGHLSRHCPQNKNGIYPQGGSCLECGSVQHFKRDCPLLKKTKETPEATVHIMDVKDSADADIFVTSDISKPVKTPKIVKF